MQLKEYLRTERLTLSQFGRMIGRSHATVSRLCEGHSSPSLELAARIEEKTCGKVTPADFLATKSMRACSGEAA